MPRRGAGARAPSGNDAAVSTYDSSTWTGLPRAFILAPEQQVALVSELDVAERQLGMLGLGQEVAAQARAYIVAARVLAEAPEPASDLIWTMLGRLNNIAGVASLLVGMIALFRT